MSAAPPVRSASHDRRQRQALVGLAVLFFAPLAVSFYLYYGHAGWRPGGHVNHGDLIDPARPLPEVALPLASPSAPATSAADALTSTKFLLGKWTLLYWSTGDCPARCRTRLYDTRQVRIALDRNMDRVQRVFVAGGECCDWDYLRRQHPDLLVVRDSAAARPLLDRLPTWDGIDPRDADRVYVIDPLGNLMMSYAPDARAKGLLQDLKRLLGLSSVG